MINKFKKAYEKITISQAEYEHAKKDFLVWLEKEILNTCGATKLSQRLGKSNSFVSKAFERGSAEFYFWIMLYYEMVKLNEEKSRLLR